MELPVVFSTLIEHSAIQIRGFKPISAGFCEVWTDIYDVISYAVYGESNSLKLKSRPEDADIINREFERKVI